MSYVPFLCSNRQTSITAVLMSSCLISCLIITLKMSWEKTHKDFFSILNQMIFPCADLPNSFCCQQQHTSFPRVVIFFFPRVCSLSCFLLWLLVDFSPVFLYIYQVPSDMHGVLPFYHLWPSYLFFLYIIVCHLLILWRVFIIFKLLETKSCFLKPLLNLIIFILALEFTVTSLSLIGLLSQNQDFGKW